MKVQTIVLLSFFSILLANNINAQAITVKTYNAKFSLTEGKSVQHAIGNPATTIAAKPSGTSIYGVVYFKFFTTNAAKIKAKNTLKLQVNKFNDDGTDTYYWYNDVPMSRMQSSIYSNFIPGKYKIMLTNAENESDIYYTGEFTVTGTDNKASSKLPDYKNNNTFVICKKVDDNWNPIGSTKTLKSGDCFQMLYKAKDKMYVDNFMVWTIFMVKPDNSLEYIDEWQMQVGSTGGQGYRFLSTDDICRSLNTGKYRAYLIEKSEWDAHHGDAEATNYFGKTEFSVK